MRAGHLMKRLAEKQRLRDEISELRLYIARLPSELRDGAYGQSYRRRLESLLSEVRLQTAASRREATS